MSTPTSPNDDGLFQNLPTESDIPAGVDRRAFFMRNAVIGAAAVMTGYPPARFVFAVRPKWAKLPKAFSTSEKDAITAAR